MYNAASGTEHLIQEVVFRDAAVGFGLVVPTPSKPDVGTVASGPFHSMRAAFPFAPDRRLVRPGDESGSVEVLARRKTTSFTAFVLAAADEHALARWLHDNGIVTTPESKKWLARYARMGFHFVALRYDPPLGEPGDEPTSRPMLRSETIRISFATPAPYYPYLEPESPERTKPPSRLLDLWLISTEPQSPVASSESPTGRAWVNPLLPGSAFVDAREAASAALGRELSGLLPSGAVTVQTFQDQKSSRSGFGDILFVPEERRPISAARRDALSPLLGVLDATLVPNRPGDPQ